MKLKFLTLLLLLGLGISAQIDLGLRAGLGLAQAGINNFESAQQAIEGLETSDRELSFHAGLYLKIDAPMFFVQPEVIFSQISQSVNAQQVGTGEL